MTPHAWIVRAEGAGCWAEDLTFVNTYRGVDFGSAKCDDFLIKGIWGTSVDNTVRVGGGSENGHIEYIMSTFSNWWEDINRADTVIEEYTYQNTVGVKLGDVKNVAGIFPLRLRHQNLAAAGGRERTGPRKPEAVPGRGRSPERVQPPGSGRRR